MPNGFIKSPHRLITCDGARNATSTAARFAFAVSRASRVNLRFSDYSHEQDVSFSRKFGHNSFSTVSIFNSEYFS